MVIKGETNRISPIIFIKNKIMDKTIKINGRKRCMVIQITSLKKFYSIYMFYKWNNE